MFVLGFRLALRRVWGPFWNWDVEFGVKVTGIETSSKAKDGSLDELHFGVPTPTCAPLVRGLTSVASLGILLQF